jgi:hypothetical protein
MRRLLVSSLALIVSLAACGPTAEERAAANSAADQNKCQGFGFQSGTDSFAHCMMTRSSEREAQEAADRRAAAARQAAADRQNAAIQAQKAAADRDAWDRKTSQGAYANSPPDPADAIRASIQNDIDNMQHAGMTPQ